MVQENHFLGCLQSAVLRANKCKGTRLSSGEMKDLGVLSKDFLVVSHNGINLSLLTTQEPNNISGSTLGSKVSAATCSKRAGLVPWRFLYISAGAS
jgi:hypothetical protein